MPEIPEQPKRTLRVIRDEEFSDDYHDDFTVYSGHLMVARIYSQDIGQGTEWIWSINDQISLMNLDEPHGGSEDSFEEAKKAVTDYFVRWVNWAGL